jgi:spore germination cell wall hydrolase CwlJ-like protein
MEFKKLLWANLTVLVIIFGSIWYSHWNQSVLLDSYFKHHSHGSPKLKTQYEILQLTRLINSESGGENFIDKLYVGSVVLNWMRKNECSIDAVIYYPNKFSGVHGSGFKYDEESKKAAEILLEYGPIDTSVYYFINPEIATNTEWKKIVMRREMAFKNTNHIFYK